MAIGTDQTLAPRVLLIGASSQIGVFAIPRLLKAGFSVCAVSRGGRPANYPQFTQVDWRNENQALEATRDCQYLVSAGPMELAQKFLTVGEQFKSAVVFSSTSVETKLASEDDRERAQMQSMLQCESTLQKLAESKSIKLLILRPTLVYGCGLDTNISRLADWVRRFGVMPVNGRAGGLRQPVHADDLAAVVVDALLTTETLPNVLTVAGGETLSYADMVGKIFTALGKPVRLVRLPEWLFVLLVNTANSLKAGGGINSEMVRRQAVDMVFDDQPARELLGYNPRPFNPADTDFSLPDFK